MKVSIAVIKLVLRTNKVLADGSHPIMLRCSFNGMKEISTHYSVPAKFWDKKNELVKKGYPNYVMINFEIQRLKNEATERRNEFERLGEVYTPSMVLSPKKELSGHRNDLNGLIDDYIKEKGIKEATAYNWHYLGNLIKAFDGDNVIVNELKLAYVKKFIKWMQDERRLSDGVIKMVLSKVQGITNYAIRKGLMSPDDYPFKDFSINNKFKTASKLDYIHWRTLDVMKEMLMDEMIDSNGVRWTYRENTLDDLFDLESPMFAHFLFMSGVLWQGLAPVDLGHIEKKDINIREINGSNYFCWDGKRFKTGKSVKVRIKADTIYTGMMVRTLLMFNNSKWLFPILNGREDASENTRKHRISWVFAKCSPKLKEWFRAINEEVAKRNVENSDNIPLISMDCTYYSYRHSYAMAYMMKGGSPMALATLLGRSPNTLAQYITELKEEGDLADAVGIMDI